MNDRDSLESLLSKSKEKVELIRERKASIQEEIKVLMADMALLEKKEEELVIQQNTIKERLEKLQEEELRAAMAVLTTQNKEK